ncbi:MAG: phosphotransferase [bacterium]|nr:phosphotransferase [bacterium]
MKQKLIQEIQHIPEVLSFFGFDKSVGVTPVKDGIANHNYTVKTPKGEYVVRFLISQKTETIKNDVAIQKQMKNSGISVPEYIQNKDGLYAFTKNNINAVISKKIEGDIPRTVNRTLAFGIGQSLAMFHNLVTWLPHKNTNGLLNPKASGIYSDIFSHTLPKGIIHGDFHSGNILVETSDHDHIVAILDFEESGENLYLIDLSTSIMAVCSSTDENALDLDLINSVINGYESVRKLTDEEMALFPEAIKYSAESWIKWFNENSYPKYAEKHKKRLNSFNQLVSTHHNFWQADDWRQLPSFIGVVSVK